MNAQLQKKLKSIFEEFITIDDFKSATLLSQGHINSTYKIDTIMGNPYILQKINHTVFKAPNKLDFNMRVVDRLHKEASPDYDQYIFPQIFLVTEGNHLLIKHRDSVWRLMDFITNTRSYEHIESPEMAYEAAKLYGAYQHELNKLDIQWVYTPIMNFRNLSTRIRALKSTIKRDVKGRKQSCEEVISLAIKHSKLEDVYKFLHQYKKIKKRVTHNDTKPSNILFSSKDNKARAVIDYDTIMPGYTIYDFGDMVRSFTPNKAEDDKNIADLEMRIDIYEAIAEAYLYYQKDDLNAQEIEHLTEGAKIVIYMQAIRFLTDYLNGDIYYKTSCEDHNLLRAKNQFALLENLLKKRKECKNLLNNTA